MYISMYTNEGELTDGGGGHRDHRWDQHRNELISFPLSQLPQHNVAGPLFYFTVASRTSVCTRLCTQTTLLSVYKFYTSKSKTETHSGTKCDDKGEYVECVQICEKISSV